MLKLKNVIRQLDEKDYAKLSQNFNDNKANKYFTLMEALRENNMSDTKMMDKLDVKVNAYYTLKSRLYDKVQDYLITNLDSPKVELFRKVANIPNLIFNTDKDTAIAILTKLEKDLKEYDLPYELTSVYSALKKLSLNSEKFYNYSQQYNQHVAHTLALDKVEDLLADFNIKLGEYYLSRDNSQIEILQLLRDEARTQCNLYDSHHMKLYEGLINISFNLFLPSNGFGEEEDPIEDVLYSCENIINDNPTDVTYHYLKIVLQFLAFEYYHSMKIYKKESEYFDLINDKLADFLLYNFCTIPTKFLISKMERYIRLDQEGELYEENKRLLANYEPSIEDVPNYVSYMKYRAMSCYYAGKYDEALDYINKIQNQISFKNYPHAELETKIMSALFFSMQDEYDLATNLLRRVADKVREMKDLNYENTKIFVKLMKTQMKTDRQNVEVKLEQLRDNFLLHNQGETRMLEFLKMDALFIENLAKTIKT